MSDGNWRAVERRRATRYRIAVAVFCVGVFIACYAAINSNENGPDARGLLAIAMTLGVAVAMVGVGGMFAFRSDDAERTREGPGSYRDRMQRDWVSRINILPAATLGITVVAMTRAQEWLSGEDTSWQGVGLAGAAALNLLLIPVMIMGWDGASRKMKRLLDDELTRAYRASAMTWAFLVLLVGGTGAYLVGLWNADVTVIALPMILWLAAATAALRFTALHRRAEREMEGDDG